MTEMLYRKSKPNDPAIVYWPDEQATRNAALGDMTRRALGHLTVGVSWQSKQMPVTRLRLMAHDLRRNDREDSEYEELAMALDAIADALAVEGAGECQRL